MFQPYRNDRPKATIVDEKMRLMFSPPYNTYNVIKQTLPQPNGGAENDEHENDGTLKCLGMNLADVK